MRDFNRDFEAARDGKFADKGREELLEIQRWAVNFLATNPRDPMATVILEEARREISSRKADERHDESLNVQQSLKSSLNELKNPHWTLTPGFIVGFLAMIFAAIAAWPVIREWLPNERPLNKAANFQQLQSNSAAAKFQTSQTSS